MLDSFIQPYFGANVSWPRLVTLLEGDKLVLNFPMVQWNTADVELIGTVLPRTGALIIRIDREFSELAEMPGINAWTKCEHVGTVVIHGAYNHDAESDRDIPYRTCSIGTAETTKTHIFPVHPAGAVVHILSEDFFLSFCPNYRQSPKVSTFAFNKALTSLTGLKISNARTPHEEQFAAGVTAPYYDLVCAHRDPILALTCAAYRTQRYVAPASPAH